MAAVPVSKAMSTGLVITTPTTAAAASQTIAANDGRTVLVVKTGASATNVTMVTPHSVADGDAAALATPDRTVAVAANAYVLIGPFPPGIYNDANGDVTITIDTLTSVVLTAVRVNQS